MNTKTKPTTAAAAPEAPLGHCPKCNKPLHYYDGALGYEAARCETCNFERDLNAEANGNPIEGEFAPAKPAHTPKYRESFTIDEVLDKYQQLLKQRDELLAACKLMAEHLDRSNVAAIGISGQQPVTIESIRAAIAAAEGSAQ